jgi:hypothetical protein
MVFEPAFWDRWVNRREDFRRLGVMVDGAKLLGEILDDVRQCVGAQNETTLTLRQSAAETGYSVDHLARLIRQGRIPNSGRRGAPRIRVADLPPARKFAGKRSVSYDVNADARTLKNGRQ